MLGSATSFMADSFMSGHTTEMKTVIAAFFVGTIVGITGMGGGALMTPALIFLGVGDASAVVTADLTSDEGWKAAMDGVDEAGDLRRETVQLFKVQLGMAGRAWS